jgi:putative membrane protein
MKNARTLAKGLFGAAFLSLFLGFSSCKNESKAEDTKEVAEDQNDAKFENNDTKEDDSEFLVSAAESDLMEIEIGKLALAKGTSSHVKDFANMLIADHTKSSNETKPFAERLQVSLPAAITEKGKEKYNDLNDEKPGKDFDGKFADMMVANHNDAISRMETASENANDAEIRAWAAKMVPTLKMHLQHAKSLQEQVKNQK